VPKTMEEACFLLLKYEEEAKIIVGGIDVLLQMRCWENSNS
jgi:CO/xanthine dehydrogenase FAD-binding subunit